MKTISRVIIPMVLLFGCEGVEPVPKDNSTQRVSVPSESPHVGKFDRVASGSSVTQGQLDTLKHIRTVAQDHGLSHGAPLAGIAFAETGLAHCWSDAQWACQGPYSSDCGGPVTAGAGDGPCSWREGGLGMFQFDAGTFDQTIAREGAEVLMLNGNIRLAVEFVARMLVDSPYVAVSSRQSALQWLSGVRPGTQKFATWIKAVTHHYNGCEPGYCSIYQDRFNHYSYHAKRAFSEVPDDFWNASTPQSQPQPASPQERLENSDIQAMELWWARQDDGSYHFKALAPVSVKSVRYSVDGYVIADEISRDDPQTSASEINFPAKYRFGTEQARRHVLVEGMNRSGTVIARGVGLIDAVPGTGVAIRQIGPALYQMSLERAPEQVVALSVEVDGYTLADAVTGEERSPRLAIRTSFTRLGEREFVFKGFNDSGTVVLRRTRTFTLE